MSHEADNRDELINELRWEIVRLKTQLAAVIGVHAGGRVVLSDDYFVPGFELDICCENVLTAKPAFYQGGGARQTIAAPPHEHDEPCGDYPSFAEPSPPHSH